jgi:hypothetical protein
MAKAHSPLRLEKQLVEQATLSGKLLHRSAAEQIEYWADIGRTVSSKMSPDALLQVISGLAQVKVEPVVTPVVDADLLFGELEEDRQSGALAQGITQSAVNYQASAAYPGLLEQIDHDGKVVIGSFQNGAFKPHSEISN